MAWVEAAIWLIYGLSIADRALIIGGSGGAAMATVIVARVLVVNYELSRMKPNRQMYVQLDPSTA